MRLWQADGLRSLHQLSVRQSLLSTVQGPRPASCAPRTHRRWPALHTVDLLRRVSKADAEIIAKLGGIVLDEWIFKDAADYLEEKGSRSKRCCSLKTSES